MGKEYPLGIPLKDHLLVVVLRHDAEMKMMIIMMMIAVCTTYDTSLRCGLLVADAFTRSRLSYELYDGGGGVTAPPRIKRGGQSTSTAPRRLPVRSSCRDLQEWAGAHRGRPVVA